MQQPAHILVIRFSAMGDVAMTVPVIKNLLQQNPQLQVTVVSNAFLQPMFEGLDRCSFYGAHLKTTHNGFKGMYRLFKELKALTHFDAVADLHNVLRSQILRTFFKVNGYPVAAIDKGRAAKKQLTQKENKVLVQLTPMHERYAVVLRKLGLPVTLRNDTPVYEQQSLPVALVNSVQKGGRLIGVAPFAQYTEKMYPPEKMKLVIKQLAAFNNTILLFGGAGKDAVILQQWDNELEKVINVAGKYSLREELDIISQLDVMVSMDSANMHLASLFNIPVVSIWGATHPYLGFFGWGQDVRNIVDIELYCRPCSVFGNKPCYRGDHACMNRIDEGRVVDKVQKLLRNDQ